jgi:hypothetical protein
MASSTCSRGRQVLTQQREARQGPQSDLYAQVGVEYMWLVEPIENLIEAYRREGDAWLRLGAWAGEVSARIPPFDAVELELGPLWVKKNPNLPR